MVELNDAGRGVHDGYSNYETVQKNVKRRLSQRMIRNDCLLGPFLTVSVHCSSEVSSGFGTLWKQNEVKTSFDLQQ